MLLRFLSLASTKHKQTRLCTDGEMLGNISASLQNGGSLFPPAAQKHRSRGCGAEAARPSPSSARWGQKWKKVQSPSWGELGPFCKAGRNGSRVLITPKDATTPRQFWHEQVSGESQGMQAVFMSMPSPALAVSGGGLTCTVCLWSGFPYADAHYVICPVYLHSLWGPFCSCARLGLKIHVSLFKSLCVHIQSTCNTSRGLPLLNKFADLPLTFILVIYIKSFSRRIEALLYTVGSMNGFSRKLKSIVLSDSISARCSTVPGVIWWLIWCQWAYLSLALLPVSLWGCQGQGSSGTAWITSLCFNSESDLSIHNSF